MLYSEPSRVDLHLHGASVTLYRRVSTRQQSVVDNRARLERSTRLFKFHTPSLSKAKLTNQRRPTVVREKIPVHTVRIPSECHSVRKRTGRCCQNSTTSCRLENEQLRSIRRARDADDFQKLIASYNLHERAQDTSTSTSEETVYPRLVYEELFERPVSFLRKFVEDWTAPGEHMSAAISAVEELTRELRQARLSEDQDGGTPTITISDCSGSSVTVSTSSVGNSICGFSDNEEGETRSTVRLVVPRVSSVSCESRPP